METTVPNKGCVRCGAPVPPDSLEGLCPKCLLAQGMIETTAEDSTPASGPESLVEIAPHFPQFQILALLGRGGMGVVYKARQPNLDRIIALKILPLAASQNPSFADRFSREARALAKLTHPGIVAI